MTAKVSGERCESRFATAVAAASPVGEGKRCCSTAGTNALAMSASETRVARAKAAPGEWDGIGFSDSLVSGSHSGRGTDKLDMVRCASES